MRTLHPSDLGVERRIHEAYKNQRFIGRDFEEAAADETPYSTMITFDPRTMIPTTPMPSQLKATTKRAFKVVKKRKKAEALAARARHLTGGGQKDSGKSQYWLMLKIISSGTVWPHPQLNCLFYANFTTDLSLHQRSRLLTACPSFRFPLT